MTWMHWCYCSSLDHFLNSIIVRIIFIVPSRGILCAHGSYLSSSSNIAAEAVEDNLNAHWLSLLFFWSLSAFHYPLSRFSREVRCSKGCYHHRYHHHRLIDQWDVMTKRWQMTWNALNAIILLLILIFRKIALIALIVIIVLLIIFWSLLSSVSWH